MPLYYFRITGSPSIAGGDGIDLADDDAAWSLAVTSTGEVLRDLGCTISDAVEIVATVHNPAGRVVGTLRILGDRGLRRP